MKNINAKGGAAFARSSRARAASDTTDIQVLVAATAKRYALKTGAKFLEVNLDVTTPIYAKFGGNTVVAAVPVADDITGTAPFVVKSGDTLTIPDGVTHVSLIASANTVVSIASFNL
ncbi:hypothetical protein CC53_gp174 [Rhizobium phage vB_RleS_L338C]|uniref:hypothetical protein n=1 Tax=Rhizobium phage vB_RleS_L338C TaxID=1414737 RepID=UPI0003D7E68D|nr:hypothetical protein CC53_gp174 [Rhizobium phage vB_RleS_L338C]AHC30591.1 hypothetical protein L338C_174 [Rhizobium phage vB_RleS_L338C]QNH72136.1 hypothetical protein P11VFA_144 [Rhizobium phage P11VFA]